MLTANKLFQQIKIQNSQKYQNYNDKHNIPN